MLKHRILVLPLTLASRQAPRVLWIETIVERFNLFSAFGLGELVRVGGLVECRS